MALFVLGDTHLSLGASKPMDVFPGWNGYVERLERNWRKLIKPEDTIVLAGDISWAMRLTDTRKDFAFLQQLPGQKLIMKGNHDYWWTTANKMNAYLKAEGFDTLHILHNNSYAVEGYAICGTRGWLFDVGEAHDEKVMNREIGRLKMSLDAAEPGLEKLVFLHYPPVYTGTSAPEIVATLKANGILPDTAGILCAGLIMVLRYLSLIMGWRTKPPRDYSDTVVESVARPMRFIARKVHVPIGKTARERQGTTKFDRFKRKGKKLYDRLSGRWMDDAGEHFQPTVLMDKLVVPLADEDEHASEPAPDPSDRLFVDRDELYRIIGLDHEPRRTGPQAAVKDSAAETKDSKSAEGVEGADAGAARKADGEPAFDPFEPQTPDPKKPQHNPRDQKKRS